MSRLFSCWLCAPIVNKDLQSTMQRTTPYICENIANLQVSTKKNLHSFPVTFSLVKCIKNTGSRSESFVRSFKFTDKLKLKNFSSCNTRKLGRDQVRSPIRGNFFSFMIKCANVLSNVRSNSSYRNWLLTNHFQITVPLKFFCFRL